MWPLPVMAGLPADTPLSDWPHSPSIRLQQTANETFRVFVCGFFVCAKRHADVASNAAVSLIPDYFRCPQRGR